MQFALEDETWDIHLDSTGNIAVLSDKPFGPLLSQRIKHRLQTFRGECFLDREVGVPYFSEVLKKNPDFGHIRSLLASVIRGVENVAKILSLEINFAQDTRVMTASFRVLGSDGSVAEGEV